MKPTIENVRCADTELFVAPQLPLALTSMQVDTTHKTGIVLTARLVLDSVPTRRKGQAAVRVA